MPQIAIGVTHEPVMCGECGGYDFKIFAVISRSDGTSSFNYPDGVVAVCQTPGCGGTVDIHIWERPQRLELYFDDKGLRVGSRQIGYIPKVHFDPNLDGVVVCQMPNFDQASEDINEVTCLNCLRRAGKHG
jgi:hypothetical protein